MQLYPEKYDKLELDSSERSFVRTIERAFSERDFGYFVLHINPRRRITDSGSAELFDLLICDEGILLFRFININNTLAAISTLNAMSNLTVFDMLLGDIRNKLKESNYLVDENSQLKFSFSVCFVFPRISFSEIYTQIGEASVNFAKDHCLFSDDIISLRKEGAEALMPRFSIKERISEDDVNCIFQRLCPEITIPKKQAINEYSVIDSKDERLEEIDRSVISYRLDSWQIDVVNKINKGNQLILACAGSGKSVLLISKCFKLASLNPDKQFLITCYNRNLFDYYQWAIAQAGFRDKNVQCVTFYGLCKRLLEKNYISLPTSYHNQEELYFSNLFNKANEALQDNRIRDRFFGVFIDEVQIFKPEWYRFCFNLLKSKDENSHYFVIAGDKSQDIKANIKHGKAPWQGGGEQYPEYRGKTLPIERNYRNSKPINDAIDRFVEHAISKGQLFGVDLSSDPELFLRGTAYRSGHEPSLIELSEYSNEGEAKAICDSVKELINQGYSEVDIAIIVYNKVDQYTSRGWATRYYSLLPYIKRRFYDEGWEDPAILMAGENTGTTYGSRRGITIATIEGSLGLDFRAVVLAGLRPLGKYEKARIDDDLLEVQGEELADRLEGFKKNINYVYTGCTRARDELTIVLSAPKGESIYMDLLREAIGGVGQ